MNTGVPALGGCMMESVIAALKDTPIPTILVVAGIVFLLLAIAGQLAGRVTVAPERQRWAAIIGGGLLAIGVALHVVPQVGLRSREPERTSAPTPSPSVKEELPSKPAAQPSTQEKEPNNHIANATLITEGTIVYGLTTADDDRDFFKFNASSTETRVILRKRFSVCIDVYDRVEKRVTWKCEGGDRPVSFSFASNAGSLYYILVKSSSRHGDYELVIQKE
jgi:hypothetical protein